MTKEVLCRRRSGLWGAGVGNHPGLPGPDYPYLMNSSTEDIVLVLAGIHAAAEFVAARPER